MTHTPGPWEAADRGDYGDFDGNSRVVLGDDRRIAVVQHSGTDEDEANARLITAAPDMLEALQVFVEHRSRVFHAQMRDDLDSIPTGRIDEIIDQIHAAIARATETGDGG